jgi:hypothetical protein
MSADYFVFGEGHSHLTRSGKFDVRFAATLFAVDFGGNHSGFTEERRDLLLRRRKRQTLRIPLRRIARTHKKCENRVTH